MKYNFVDFSIVVTANSNNPTILNKDFLQSNKIIPKSWTVKGQHICTPPISQIEFEEGIKIISQLDKVIFLEKELGDWPNKINIPKIAQKYIETLPHVQYLAVGINLKNTYEFQNIIKARDYIIKKFIKEGPWLTKEDDPIKTGVNLQLPLSKNHRLNLSIQDIDKPDTKKGVVLISYNFHTDIILKRQKDKINKIIEEINNWKECNKKFNEINNLYFKE